MSLTVLAQGDSSGGGSGDIFQASLSQLASLALNISIGQVSEAQLEGLINPAAWQAEAGQPEGAQIQFQITGWTLFGTDYSSTIANQINSYWQQGQFTVNGEAMQAWPGASAIAYGGNDTVTVRYLKGQFWILWVALAIAVAVWLYNILTGLTGGHAWSLGVNSASTSSGGGMPLWEKVLIGLGITAVVAGGIMFWGKLEIAKAGAGKSSVNIYEAPR